MQLAPSSISKRPKTHSVYTACDQAYFDEFGPAFAHSIMANTEFDVHFHIFNPRPEHIDFCESHARITYGWEVIAKENFLAAAQRWRHTPTDPQEKSFLDRTVNAMGKGGDHDILDRMQKTYFACVRFVRLSEIFDPAYHMFAMDVDAVVRSPLVSPGQDHDFFIHRISGRKARYLAGGIWLRDRAANLDFLQAYAAAISDFFHRDYVYWGIDQDVLETLVPGHSVGQLPVSYIDWNWGEHSMVWTAKGTRKSDPVFQAVKLSYQR